MRNENTNNREEPHPPRQSCFFALEHIRISKIIVFAAPC